MPDFTTSDGLRLHYTETGDPSGRPLLCLAGLTRNSDDFGFLADALPDARLIALDYRGRGLSQYDPDYMNYNVLREGHDALELLDHLGLDSVVVMGTSRGGLIAMALAASAPERLRGVILNDVGPEIGPDGMARIMTYLGITPDAPDLDTLARRMQAAEAQDFPGVPLDIWRRQVAAQFAETPDGLALRYDPALRRAILEQAAGQVAPDLWLFFEALKTLPTAVLHGENSDILLADTVAEMARRHPGLIVATIPDRGHVPFLNEPASVAAIRQVLEQAH